MKAGQQMSAMVAKKPRRRVKKVKGHSGHHGGAWKVAYADFVTAMMALFLVLWLVSQADTKLKEAIANYFRSPGVFTSMRGGVLDRQASLSKEPTTQDNEQALMGAAAHLQKKFQKNPEFESVKDQVKIEMTEEGLRIQILDKAERTSFSSGSAELTPAAQAILTEIARNICELPNPIFIGGHTDRLVFPAGSPYTNWELSTDRANAARRYLETGCVKPEQIRRVVGYADTEPLIPADPYAPANRRISIVLSRQGVNVTPPKVNLKPELDKSTRGAPEEAAPNPASASEKRLSNTKLATEGSVSVGGADQLPAGVKRTRE
jgi:chemotaxis protein MotB